MGAFSTASRPTFIALLLIAQRTLVAAAASLSSEYQAQKPATVTRRAP